MTQAPLTIPPREQWSREEWYRYHERLAIALDNGVAEDRAEELAVSAVLDGLMSPPRSA